MLDNEECQADTEIRAPESADTIPIDTPATACVLARQLLSLGIRNELCSMCSSSLNHFSIRCTAPSHSTRQPHRAQLRRSSQRHIRSLMPLRCANVELALHVRLELARWLRDSPSHDSKGRHDTFSHVHDGQNSAALLDTRAQRSLLVLSYTPPAWCLRPDYTYRHTQWQPHTHTHTL